MIVPDDLREVALAAACAFLAEEVSLEFLGHSQSLACRTSAPSGDYLLRVHAPRRLLDGPAFHTIAAIESECAWLQALSDDSELVVQRPVASPTGGYVLHLPSTAAGELVPCTLLSWVEGAHLDGKRTAEQAKKLGELLAALHAHARAWTPPPDFARPSLGTAAWRSALARVDHLVSIGVTSQAERALLTRAVDLIDRELTPLARVTARNGLVHADLPRIEGYFVASLVEVFGNNAEDPEEHEYLSRAVPAWSRNIRHYVEGLPFLFGL